MSRPVFDLIHASWPQLEICVIVVNRQDTEWTAPRRMDIRLLSSPLLVELTYVVYDDPNWRADVPCFSEWPQLSQALANGNNLRIIRLQGQHVRGIYTNSELIPRDQPEKLARIDFESGLRLPKLEKLCISAVKYNYLWDAKHCHMIRDSIDCSRLRKLDFGDKNPEAFFRCFTGLVPALKHLRFKATENATEPAKAFIRSLEALEQLDVVQAQNGIDDLWPAIKQHNHTLRTLSLGPTVENYCSIQSMDLRRLEAVAMTFPKLKRLGWTPPYTTYVSVLC